MSLAFEKFLKTADVVKKRLKSYLSKDQLFALMVRRDLIVEKIEELVEEKRLF